MKFTFTDKTSYLAFRQEWKDNYAKLSADIRKQKRGRKQFIRSYITHETPQGKVRELVSKVDNPHFGEYQMWQLHGLQAEAWSQMEILKEAKTLSWSLKEAEQKKQAALTESAA